MEEKISAKTVWDEAARSGLILGLFSAACLGLKELSSLSSSTFLVTAAAIVLWALEFFGCIFLMQRRMNKFYADYQGVTFRDVYVFGRRVALLSGLILAAVNAGIIYLLPDETMDAALAQVYSSMGSSMTASMRDTMEGIVAKMPVYVFFFQWFYCFIYGTILSAILSRRFISKDIMGE